MVKIHWIGAGDLNGWQRTACGLYGFATPHENVYSSMNGKTMLARFRSWNAVTCRSCLRNPHAPGGRVFKAIAEATAS